MVGLFYLLTLYGALRYWTAGDEPARVGWLLFATTACLAGMASKEVMVTAPVVVLLFERAFVAGSLRQALRQSWPLYVGLALGWTLLFALNRAGPRTASAGFQLGAAVRVSPWIYWCTEAKVLFLYLKLAVWPWPLVIHYDMTFINAFATAWPWVLPAVLLALASLYLWWRNTATGFVAAALWIILSPTLVVPVLSEVAAERRMYLPMAAVCALVVAGGYSVLGRIWPRRTTAAARGSNGPGRGAVVAATVAVVVIAATFAALDVKRMTAYESEIGLWEDTLRNQPHNALALTSLGISLMHAGRNEEAIERLTEAVQYAFFGISEAQFRVKLAMALAGVDRVDEAIFEYREALRLGFNNPAEIHLSIGVLLLGADRGEEGLRELEEALRLKPDSPQVHSYLGLALLQLGRSREAATRLKHAVRLAPGSADAHYNLGRALAKDKELRQAIEEFQEALRLQPDFPAATKALAHALVDSQQSAAAVGLLRKAVEAEPENGELRYAFGRALAGAGRLPDAIVQFQSAEQHGERTGALYRAYGHALLQLRRPGEAAARLELAASLDPNDAETLFAAAKARAQAQQPEQAVAAAERALDLARTNGLTDLAAEIDAWLIEFRRHPFSP
ncbi:MAG TPA: tetratricopeptide repeat protein, partial [Pirellulales bacterium]|nr:tetratricopeptide repeat protein [Pirellulales bacterium]